MGRCVALTAHADIYTENQLGSALHDGLLEKMIDGYGLGNKNSGEERV